MLLFLGTHFCLFFGWMHVVATSIWKFFIALVWNVSFILWNPTYVFYTMGQSKSQQQPKKKHKTVYLIYLTSTCHCNVVSDILELLVYIVYFIIYSTAVESRPFNRLSPCQSEFTTPWLMRSGPSCASAFIHWQCCHAKITAHARNYTLFFSCWFPCCSLLKTSNRWFS